MAASKDSGGSKAKQDDSGTHPARPVSEADDAAENKSYKDNPDKPDPSTVAQVEVTDK